MTTYSFSNSGRLFYYCTVAMFLSFPILAYKLHAPLDVWAASAVGLVFIAASGGIAPVNGRIVLDDNGIKYFDNVLWRRGVPQGGDWNEVVRAEGTYLLPWLPVFMLYFSVNEGKERSWFVPIIFFPPDLVGDVLFRLSEDVQVSLASDFSRNYHLD